MQLAIRHVCQEFARVVGSPLAIYLADGWEPIDASVEGRTIEEIVEQLHATLGSPIPTLTMLSENTIGQATHFAYYLDTFADL